MDKYTVLISPQAYRDIDETYEYIRTELFAEKAALDLVDDIEPDRGAERKVGIYAGKGYRQLFVKNYTIVYRVEDLSKTVMIITVKFSHQNF